jgi:hypothetical protein
VSQDHEADERDWDADKRDFVADRRDDVAAYRDEAADTRDRTAADRERMADERDAALDERQSGLDAYAAELGRPPAHTQEARDCAATATRDAAAERNSARQQRDQGSGKRDEASAARDEAAKRRRAATPTTGLALAFAEIARYLYEADDFDEVLARVTETAVAAVAGCDMASVTVQVEQATFRTAASTHAAALAADAAQYEAKEGPCLDALEEAVVHTPFLPDPRWPRLGAGLIDSGMQSVISYRLASSTAGALTDDTPPGSLNAYAGTPNAFDSQAQEIGFILAAHASVAVRAVHERQALEQLGRNLHQALSSRDVIGQAKGILMERLRVTPEDAFDLLRRASQQLNVKLREVAQQLAETGEFHGAGRD